MTPGQSQPDAMSALISGLMPSNWNFSFEDVLKRRTVSVSQCYARHR
jgi:hypothetical protein